ncbi:MAG TPA: CBS domain-containing protein [Verrucomicrobiae bacterium]|nr:CBS domain-containing protein [Verrucomicrobiae bacterium]
MVFTAKDVCNKAITIEATKMMSDVREIMLKYNISRIIIENNQKPVGMVTEKGISRYLYKENNDKSLDEIVISKAMRAPLISVPYDKDIRECAKLMRDNEISSLIVEAEEDGKQGERIFLFTKSDLVKLYAENYKGKYKVDDYMTKQVFTISPSNSLHTVMKILIKERISRVIVTNRDNEIIGVVTAKDLMPITAFAESDGLQINEKGKEEIEKTNLASIGHAMIVRDIMKKPVITVKSTDDLAKAAQIMTDKMISGVPVTNSNNDNKDLAGIITKTDIVNALVESNY